MLSCLLYLALGWAYPQCSAEFPSAGKHISGIFFILRESQFFFSSRILLVYSVFKCQALS